MGVIVTFDYPTWAARYPEFNGIVDQPTATAYWNEANLYVRNDGGGPVNTAVMQSTLLNMVTAHIAQINSGSIGNPASPLVGKISSATEGSVSVDVDAGIVPGTAAWFYMTKYGLSFWQATNGFRRASYRARPTYVAGSGPWYGW